MPNMLSMFGPAKPKQPALQVPVHCPVCGFPTKRDGEYLICPNSLRCPAQISGVIQTWIQKLGVLEWGNAIIEALCSQGMVATIPDLYLLKETDIASLQLSGRRVGESTAKRVLENLHAKKELTLAMLIGSLSIPLVARSMTKTIVSAGFDTLAKMESAQVHDIAAIPGVGPTKAANFIQGIHEKRDLIHKLLSVGVQVKTSSDGPLKGKTVCMTGFRDASMESAIEDAGGSVKSSVSKQLDYLVAADPTSTSGKAQKARDYGTKVISQEQMWSMLE
jgi:DNA ligase (NAD+)